MAEQWEVGGPKVIEVGGADEPVREPGDRAGQRPDRRGGARRRHGGRRGRRRARAAAAGHLGRGAARDRAPAPEPGAGCWRRCGPPCSATTAPR
nr:hypothetical protein [Angustibacter aerolatus]